MDSEYHCECDNDCRCRYPGYCVVKVEEEDTLCNRCQLEEEFYSKRAFADDIATEEAEDILRIELEWKELMR